MRPDNSQLFHNQSNSVSRFSKLSRHRKTQILLDNIDNASLKNKTVLKILGREITDNVHQHQRATECSLTLKLQMARRVGKVGPERRRARQGRDQGKQRAPIPAAAALDSSVCSTILVDSID